MTRGPPEGWQPRGMLVMVGNDGTEGFELGLDLAHAA